MLSHQEMKDIMLQYGNYLMQISYTYVKDVKTAEDVVQEVFIKYFKHPEKFQMKAQLKTYLTRMTINASIDYLRSWKAKRKALQSLFLQGKQEIITPDQYLLKKMENTELFQFVMTLPLKYREVIILFYYEELTTIQIAQMLRMPESTVKTRLRRAREQLKCTLDENDWKVMNFE